MASPVRLQRPSNLTLEPKAKSRVTFSEDSLVAEANSFTSPRKFRYDTEFRLRRKRANSCSFQWDSARKRRGQVGVFTPSKFLLGGNITDPLNLEALDRGNKKNEGLVSDDDQGTGGPSVCDPPSVNAGANRRGSTVRVIIPPNINDPLNLDACSEDGDEQLADAISRQLRRRKPRKRKRRNSEPTGMTFDTDADSRLSTSLEEPKSPVAVETTSEPSEDVAGVPKAAEVMHSTPSKLVSRFLSDPGIFTEKETPSTVVASSTPIPSRSSVQPPPKKRVCNVSAKTSAEDKIVSPVVPTASDRRRHSRSLSSSSSGPIQTTKRPGARFPYGNYNKYYGYRNPRHTEDPRIKLLSPELFCGRDVLDVGCNSGQVTLSVARDLSPRSVVGVDIDGNLIGVARKNVKHYLMPEQREISEQFPTSMRLLYGPLHPPPVHKGQKKFPYNVKFVQANYVPENDILLETIRPEFDIILCLSVTKWVHLNWGDAGLKRLFGRMFRHLRPGGMLILEPQGWPSYSKKKKQQKEFMENYKNIRLYPNQFGEYLTSVVGFSFLKKSFVAEHHSKGFNRPVYFYKKPTVNSPKKEFDQKRSPANKNSKTSTGDVKPSSSDPVKDSTKENTNDTIQTKPSDEVYKSTLASHDNNETYLINSEVNTNVQTSVPQESVESSNSTNSNLVDTSSDSKGEKEVKDGTAS